MDDPAAAHPELALDIQNFTVTLQDLQDLQDVLADAPPATPALASRLSIERPVDVPRGELRHRDQDASTGSSSLSLTAFPVFPGFKLKLGDADPAAFTSLAGDLFVDYFFLIVRTAVQYAVDELADVIAAVHARPPLDQLAAKLLDANTSITVVTPQPILPTGFDVEQAAANSSLSANQWKAIVTANPQTGSSVATLRANLQAAVPAVAGVAPALTTADVVGAMFANPALKLSGTINVATFGYSPVIADTATIDSTAATLNAIVARLQSAAENAIEAKSFGFSLQGVLSRLNRGGQLNHLAGIASRFLLHGVRRPAGTATQGVFEATGQDFTFAAGSTLELQKSDAPTFVTFANSAATLSYSLSDAAADVALLTGEFPAAAVANISPYYGVEPRRFANTHHVPWDFPIVELSQSLQAFLQEKGSVPANELSLYTETRPAGGDPVRTPITNFAWATKINLTIHRIPGDGGADTYVMSGASAVDNDLIEDLWNETQPQTATTPPTVKILFQAGAAGGKLTAGPPSDFLLLKSNLAAYGMRPADMPDDARPTLTAETDTGIRLYSATTTQPANFLRLIWESGGLAGGGYFLHCLPATAGAAPVALPDAIFPDQRTGSLVLLIEGAAANAHSFHNCVIVRDTGANFDETPLMVESTVTDQVFTGKTGHIGFSVLRDDASLPRGHLNDGAVLRKTPTADGAPVTVPAGTSTFIVTRRSADATFLQVTSATEPRAVRGWIPSASFTQDTAGLGALANLYQILAYKLTDPTRLNAATAGLKATANGAEWKYDPAAGGMPVGPASQSPSVDEDEGRWTYERAIPVFRLFAPGGQVAELSTDANPANLPAADANPYLGIGQNVSVELRWRDVYGHERPESRPLVLPVRYFDPLIGIHQWPSTKAAYLFDKDAAGATRLTIRLSFDPSAFQRGTDATARALDIFRTVFYQVHQSDITFQLTSSQLSAPKTLDATNLRRYVRQAYLHVAALQDPQAPPVPLVEDQTLTITFTAAELSTPAALVTPVNVKVNITRPDAKIDAAAAPVAKTIASPIAPDVTTCVHNNRHRGPEREGCRNRVVDCPCRRPRTPGDHTRRCGRPESGHHGTHRRQ